MQLTQRINAHFVISSLNDVSKFCKLELLNTHACTGYFYDICAKIFTLFESCNYHTLQFFSGAHWLTPLQMQWYHHNIYKGSWECELIIVSVSCDCSPIPVLSVSTKWCLIISLDQYFLRSLGTRTWFWIRQSRVVTLREGWPLCGLPQLTLITDPFWGSVGQSNYFYI